MGTAPSRFSDVLAQLLLTDPTTPTAAAAAAADHIHPTTAAQGYVLAHPNLPDDHPALHADHTYYDLYLAADTGHLTPTRAAALFTHWPTTRAYIEIHPSPHPAAWQNLADHLHDHPATTRLITDTVLRHPACPPGLAHSVLAAADLPPLNLHAYVATAARLGATAHLHRAVTPELAALLQGHPDPYPVVLDHWARQAGTHAPTWERLLEDVPSTRLAVTALHRGGPGTAEAVLSNSRLALPVRHRALVTVAQTAGLTGQLMGAWTYLARTAPPQMLQDTFTALGDEAWEGLTLPWSRHDLPHELLTAALRHAEHTPQAGLAALLGACLALSPSTTPELRDRAALLSPGPGDSYLTQMRHLAELGQQLNTHDPAVVGAQVPVAALAQLEHGVPLGHVVTATLRRYATHWERPEFATTALAMASGFTGTVGQLLDTVVTATT